MFRFDGFFITFIHTILCITLYNYPYESIFSLSILSYKFGEYFGKFVSNLRIFYIRIFSINASFDIRKYIKYATTTKDLVIFDCFWRYLTMDCICLLHWKTPKKRSNFIVFTLHILPLKLLYLYIIQYTYTYRRLRIYNTEGVEIEVLRSNLRSI